MDVNWNDPNSKVSRYFTVKEAIWFPQWNRCATEKDGVGLAQKQNLINLFNMLDKVRDIFGKPMIVHVAYRSYSYNKLVKGAPASSHILGMACDFHVKDVECDEVRKVLVDKLENLGFRMEDLPGSSWIHLDIRPVPKGGARYFKP